MPDPRRETLEDLTRIDRRRRARWRRAWGMLALLFLLLVVTRVWWGAAAQRRLDAVIERYRAAGEPILIADFTPMNAPRDAENAALLYEQAAVAVVIPSDMEVKGESFVADLRFAWAYPEDSRRMVEANQPVLALLKQGDALSACDWGVRYTSPMVTALLPNLTWIRNLQKTLCALAAAQHVTGDDEAALRTWSHIERINERMMTPRESGVIQDLVALACMGTMCRSIEAVAPTLRIGDSATASSNPLKPATRAQVQALIAALLDEAPLRKGWWNAITVERASMADMMTLFAKGRLNAFAVTGASGFGVISARVTSVFMGPVLTSDAVFAVEFLTQLREAGGKSTYAFAQSALPVAPPTWNSSGSGDAFSRLAGMARQMSSIVMPSLDRAMVLNYRALADRRMAATALAIRLYELDHGRRPDRLDELVPAYLPAVPYDPFAQPVGPIRYDPTASPPILYSVNVDARDDGGTWEMTPLPNMRIHPDHLDMPFFLDGSRPAAPLDLENGLVIPPKGAAEGPEDER
ncbi:MAG: hypothetical protein IT449_04240 [Phycisphaerales bacterium]|nr:hypothetical protein [Phycisphaerales bacterium]